jgi:hypothetical protein
VIATPNPTEEGHILYIDYRGKKYRWTYDPATLPDLTSFRNFGVPVVLSRQEQRWWKVSTPIAHGRYGYHRRLNTGGSLPIIKLANDEPESRIFIEKEFNNLKHCRSLGLPVPCFSDEPLLDDDQSIMGIRMAELFPIPWRGPNGMRSQMPLVEGIVWEMHEQGIAHNDISESNVMWTKHRTLNIIDLSHATLIDPHHFLNDTACDVEHLRRIYDRLVRSKRRSYERADICFPQA